MRRIVRSAFVAVQDLPTFEKTEQLARSEPVSSRFFPGGGDMHNANHQSSGPNTSLDGIEQVSLQIVKKSNQVPAFRPNPKAI
jgi:hypothetical protein